MSSKSEYFSQVSSLLKSKIFQVLSYVRHIAGGNLLTSDKIIVPRRSIFRKPSSFTKPFFLSGCTTYGTCDYLSVIGEKIITLKYLKVLAIFIARLFQVQCMYEKQRFSACPNNSHSNLSLI